MVDDITEAVLSREDIARYLRSGDGGRAARERVHAYLEELRTTQRYSIYRALKHPLYPILRKIERVGEHQDRAVTAAARGRIAYASEFADLLAFLVSERATYITGASINFDGGVGMTV